MSNHQDLARERLLDASLSELFGRREVSSSALEPAISRDQMPRRNNGWLAAALVLLGSVVVVGSWVWSPPDGQVPAESVSDQGQGKPLLKLWPRDPNDEHPYLPLTVCKSLDELEAASDDIVNLSVELSSLKDLEHLARFSHLRRLHLRGGGQGTVWTMVGSDDGVLNPLQKLQRLQVLKLPPNFALAVPHVRALRSIGSLQSLTIIGSHPLTVELAKELVAWPRLRQLQLYSTLVPPAFLAVLKGGQLQELVLAACAHVGAPEFAAIAEIKSLRSLVVMMAGVGSCKIDGKRYEVWELDASAFAAFQALPNLVALDLDESAFHDKFIPQLPKQLRYLRLGGRRMTPLTIDALKRLERLDELRFHHATMYDDVIDLLQSLKLKRVWLNGWVNDDVARALANHATLETATLRLSQACDLSLLGAAPKLRSLTLRYDHRYQAENLPPPAVIKALKDRGVQVTLDRF